MCLLSLESSRSSMLRNGGIFMTSVHYSRHALLIVHFFYVVLLNNFIQNNGFTALSFLRLQVAATSRNFLALCWLFFEDRCLHSHRNCGANWNLRQGLMLFVTSWVSSCLTSRVYICEARMCLPLRFLFIVWTSNVDPRHVTSLGSHKKVLKHAWEDGLRK